MPSRIGNWYERYIFPRLLDFVMGREAMAKDRVKALESARGEVLEIGFGTGHNLRHYPATVERLVTIDNVRLLPKKVAKRLAKASFAVEQHTLDAAVLPFDSGRFDAVVSTWTLCSIADVAAALGEVSRVLKPGGELLFVEHGRSDDPQVAGRQDRWNPWHQRFAGGCNLNRPIDRLIEDSGLEIAQLDRYLAPGTPRILAELYRGRAVKC